MQIWEQCGDCSRVPSQSQLLPAIEPGDPQRCGSTARVADSNCQRVQPALSVTAFSRASSPRGRAKGRLRRPAIYHTFPNRVTPNGVGLLPGWQARHSQRVQPALSVTATPCQLSQRESQGAGVARPAQRNFRSVIRWHFPGLHRGEIFTGECHGPFPIDRPGARGYNGM